MIFADDFSSILFQLRGKIFSKNNQENLFKRRRNLLFLISGKAFPIVITLFVKKQQKRKACKIHYYDIGDYLNREQKLQKISVATKI